MSEHAQSGVEALIERLHRDGVEAGAAEAERLVAEARAEAAHLLADAQARAETLLADARAEAERRQRSTHAALALAVRDSRLAVREALVDLFEARLASLVDEALADPGLIAELARAAGLVLAGGGPLEADIGLDPARAHILVRQLATGLADAGIRIAVAPGGPALTVRRAGAGLRLELDAQTLTALIMAHLRPHLHALLIEADERS